MTFERKVIALTLRVERLELQVARLKAENEALQRLGPPPLPPLKGSFLFDPEWRQTKRRNDA